MSLRCSQVEIVIAHDGVLILKFIKKRRFRSSVFPNMVRLRQSFDRTRVEGYSRYGPGGIEKARPGTTVKPGQRIALTAGSRGVANIALILKAAVEYFKSLGAKPFIFPAMGSHGGATAEGQTALLAHYK